jgi:hypothetical protein
MHTFQDEQAFVLSFRNDPMLLGVATYGKLPAPAQVLMWEGCARAGIGQLPTADEWLNYGASAWKDAYMLWQTLDPKHKIDKDTGQPIDLLAGVAWAINVMRGLPPNELDALRVKIAIVSQEIDIKNSSGRTPTPGPAQNQSTDAPATADGPPSTNSSPPPNTEE